MSSPLTTRVCSFRSEIQKQVLNGQLGEAIELTYQLFPGILERNPNLLFALKVRQFIEMIYNVNPKTSSSSSSCNSHATATVTVPLSSSSLLSSASNFVVNNLADPTELVNSKKTPSVDADLKDSAMLVDQESATTSKQHGLNGNDSNGYVTSKNGDTPTSEEQMGELSGQPGVRATQ